MSSDAPALRPCQVRVATPADAAAVADIRRRGQPHLVTTERALRRVLQHALDDPGAGAHVVAERDCAVVATASLAAVAPGPRKLSLLADPAWRRQGAGTALFRWAQDQAGPVGLQGLADDVPGAFDALDSWGWERSQPVRFSRTDPRRVPTAEPTPGYQLCALSDLGQPSQVWELLQLTCPDDPSGLSSVRPLEAWQADVWHNPDFDLALAIAARAPDGTLAAVTLTKADAATGRIWTAMTATHPRRRGQGLARAVKTEALRTAARRGFTNATAGNADANVAMLAVNRRLGYEVCASGWTVRWTPDGAMDGGPAR